MFEFSKLIESLISGDIERTEELTLSALEARVHAKEILDKGLILNSKP